MLTAPKKDLIATFPSGFVVAVTLDGAAKKSMIAAYKTKFAEIYP